MSHWLILGATSGIAVPLAREMAALGNDLALWDLPDKNAQLEEMANDLQIRYNIKVSTAHFNATDYQYHEDLLDQLESDHKKIYGVIWVLGVMGDQARLENDYPSAIKEHEINYTAAMVFLNRIASRFSDRKSGHIVAFGSAAGDRGRAVNYIYGSSKAAMHSLLQGLRQRLASSNVHVTTVKPGPVRTPMTAGMKNLPLLAEPEDVARNIAKAIDKKKEVVYVPWLWRYIMLIIRLIPESIFKKLSF